MTLLKAAPLGQGPTYDYQIPRLNVDEALATGSKHLVNSQALYLKNSSKNVLVWGYVSNYFTKPSRFTARFRHL